MGFLSHLLYPWGLVLQALAIIHFIRRRPDTYWLFIILFLGPVGALIYLCVEALPDVGLVRQSFKVFPSFGGKLRRTRRTLYGRRQILVGASRLRQSHCRPHRHARFPLPPRRLLHRARRSGSRVARSGASCRQRAKLRFRPRGRTACSCLCAHRTK